MAGQFLFFTGFQRHLPLEFPVRIQETDKRPPNIKSTGSRFSPANITPQEHSAAGPWENKGHQFPHGGADMVQAVRKTFLNLAMLCDHFQKIIQILRGLLLPDAVDVHGSPAGGGFQPGQPFQGGIVEYGISEFRLHGPAHS